MKQLIGLGVFLIGSVSFAQDSANVLFIGNSYTYVNDLPQLLSDFAASMGDYVYHDDQTPGGATFQTHVNNAGTFTKINSNDWDFVVLQGQSQEVSFSDTQVDNQTLPYAKQLADSVYAHQFCSEALLFMTWGRENGDPQWGPISTYEGMQDRLRLGYMRIADSVQGSVAPVGVAWRQVRENHPTIQLYSGDGSHPSLAGSYLAACTFYASVFRKSPVGAPFISSLDPTIASQLQAAAALVVLDSLDQWNLRPISEHTQAGFSFSENAGEVTFTNESTKAQTYFWDFGDGQTSTDEHPMHTYASNGNYTATLIAESPCDLDTTSVEFNLNSLGIHQQELTHLRIKNFGNASFEIVSEQAILYIKVYDCTGILVLDGSEAIVDLSRFSSGIYLLNVSTTGGIETIRVRI